LCGSGSKIGPPATGNGSLLHPSLTPLLFRSGPGTTGQDITHLDYVQDLLDDAMRWPADAPVGDEDENILKQSLCTWRLRVGDVVVTRRTLWSSVMKRAVTCGGSRPPILAAQQLENVTPAETCTDVIYNLQRQSWLRSHRSFNVCWALVYFIMVHNQEETPRDSVHLSHLRTDPRFISTTCHSDSLCSDDLNTAPWLKRKHTQLGPRCAHLHNFDRVVH
jgi:hypothetical protein